MSAVQTTAIVLTAPGRSAVAAVAVAGPAAVEIVDACFLAANGKPLADQPMGAIRFGRWAAEDGEEVIVCRRPNRATESIEIHCHGGAAAVRAVVARLVERGCVEQPWREALQEVVAGRIEREASLALRQAPTERTAAIALDQLDGAMRRELKRLVGESNERLLTKGIAELIDRSSLGRCVTRPWRVVIAGAPNVGKSSLINALLGFPRVIVFDQPGVTRDVVTADTAIEGWPIELCDTAGLRDSQDAIEAAGVRLAREALATADLVIEVRDATTPVAQAELGPGDCLRVWNKVDLAAPPAEDDALAASAATGQGVEALLAAIIRRLAPQPPKPGDAVPLSKWQAREFAYALSLAQAGNSDAAREKLQAMLASSS